MKHATIRAARRPLLAATAALLGSACGVTEPESRPTRVDGVWQSSRVGVAETTLDLAADGTATLVRADLAASTCEVSAGRWTLEGEEVVVRFTSIGGAPASGQERFTVASGGLASFRRLDRMITCVDYGWGQWTGTLSITVDGVPRDFSVFDIDLDVDGGKLQVVGLSRACDGCPSDTPQLVVELDTGAGALTPGSFTVQNVAGASRTLYGFYHPDPGSPTFLGFNTTRLSPAGEFRLEELGLDRVTGSFGFRANPLADGQVAPDGSTTTLITDGEVRVTYR